MNEMRQEIKQQTKADSLVQLLYGKNSIPHPPYNASDGKFHAAQFNSYVEAHSTRNYRGGYVIFGDGDFSRETSPIELELFKPSQLPELEEIQEFSVIPERVAVCVAEMRNGNGDLFEAVALAFALTKKCADVTLVLPRDMVSYEKTRAILINLEQEISQTGLKIADYHQTYEMEKPFNLAIYPSTQRYGGTIRSEVSVLLRESGESSPRAGVSWRADEWGG